MHSDIRPENILLTQSGKLQIIDLSSLNYGDPWSDLTQITYLSPDCYRGFGAAVVESYFDDRIPSNFPPVAKEISAIRLLTMLHSDNDGCKKVASMLIDRFMKELYS